MALVTVTYNAWDHNRAPIAAHYQPRVGFRPVATSLFRGMMTAREVWGSLNTSTGSGSVQLESSPGLIYVPFMDWLADGSQADEAVENRVRGYCEWPPIIAGNGGDISDLFDLTPYGPIVAALDAPPSGTSGIVWIDLTDQTAEGALVYAPERAF